MNTYTLHVKDTGVAHLQRALKRQAKYHRRSVERLLTQESTPQRVRALDQHRVALLEVKALQTQLSSLTTIDAPGERPESRSSAR